MMGDKKSSLKSFLNWLLRMAKTNRSVFGFNLSSFDSLSVVAFTNLIECNIKFHHWHLHAFVNF